MIASSEDARLLFDRWHQDSTPLRLKLRSSNLMFDGVGTVHSFAASSVTFSADSWNLTIPLADAAFGFSDPREVPVQSVRESESSRYEFGLSLRLPNGDHLAVLEMKIDES